MVHAGLAALPRRGVPCALGKVWNPSLGHHLGPLLEEAPAVWLQDLAFIWLKGKFGAGIQHHQRRAFQDVHDARACDSEILPCI